MYAANYEPGGWASKSYQLYRPDQISSKAEKPTPPLGEALHREPWSTDEYFSYLVGVMRKPTKHRWTFPTRFRAGAYGWRASRLACQRLREAVSEIKKVAKKDSVLGAEGAVRLMEKLWPALAHVDSSSGALGSAVNRALDALIPIIVRAPADDTTRNKWLERLWQAMVDDGVDYLSPVGDRWGEICGSVEVAGRWADELIPTLRACWSDPTPGNYFHGATAKELKLFDLALELANRSPCDPKTLTRAARNYLEIKPAFALGAAMAALRWLSEGWGYEVTSADVVEAYDRAMDAALRLNKFDDVTGQILQLVGLNESASRLFVRQSLQGHMGAHLLSVNEM
jgi:hypothetical protein